MYHPQKDQQNYKEKKRSQHRSLIVCLHAYPAINCARPPNINAVGRIIVGGFQGKNNLNTPSNMVTTANDHNPLYKKKIQLNGHVRSLKRLHDFSFLFFYL